MPNVSLTMEDQTSSWNAEEYAGIPEDLRCKRSDGKQWRCSSMSMPDKTVCEKHYIQAKKRAASSALRASLKKAKRRSLGEDDVYMESRSDDFDMETGDMKAEDYSGSVTGTKYKESRPKSQAYDSPQTPATWSLSEYNSSKSNYESEGDEENLEDNGMSYKTLATDSFRKKSQRTTDINAMMDYSDGSTDSSEETDGQTCHQCHRSDRGSITWCPKCRRRGYCNNCISSWYMDVPLEKMQRICPVCRDISNCKIRIREIPFHDKLLYLHCLLSSVLPIVKRIHNEQCSEMELEKRLCGTVTDLPRSKFNADEQLCCDFCKTPIIDYHRHCANCSYDLCLSCCQDLRETFMLSVKVDSAGTPNEGHHDSKIVPEQLRLPQRKLFFSDKFPDWNSNSDKSITCPPKRYGGCGCLSLTLRRIFKMNWVAKLAKNVEEMVSGCKIYNDDNREKISLNTSRQCQVAYKEESDDNFLYSPDFQDIKSKGISDFRKHWARGQPIIVKHVFDSLSSSSWEPMAIWRGIRETADERMKDKNIMVKAIDCLNWSEVDIELGEFVKGYSEGRIGKSGRQEMLKLKNWPSPIALDEFLLYQRYEFIRHMPLLEYIHSKRGLLNVASRLPHYSLQNDVGPKILISYGTDKKPSIGDSVNNLRLNMRDMVYLLMHTTEAKPKDCHSTEVEKIEIKVEEFQAKDLSENVQKHLDEGRYPDLLLSGHSPLGEYVAKFDSSKDEEIERNQMMETTTIVEENPVDFEHLNKNCNHASSKKTHKGVLWDVFRRHDVPKLSEYLRVHWEEYEKPYDVTQDPIVHTLYDESIYLDKQHKELLKEEFGIEPWSFEQHLGQAVFIPAGCPFQLRNLQSTVHLSLDFLLPESLGEVVKLAEEIRCLPNEHEAKLQVLEIGKMSLYAASSAIKDVEKLVLDPILGAELAFEDPNLTAAVSENLEKMVKVRQIACTNFENSVS